MHTISLTDGTTTITLTSGSYLVTEYAMTTAGAAAQPEATVTESMELLVTGANTGALRDNWRAVESILELAALRQRTGIGARVWLQVLLHGEATTWRSEIVSAKLEPERAIAAYSRLKAPATLAFERKAFWEEASETELQLSATGQAAATGGRTIYNRISDNWVQIAAAQIGGTLPAAIRLRIKNTSAGALTAPIVYAAVNAFSDPANFAHILEGEAAASGGSTQAVTGTSGGNVRRFALTTTAQSGRWTIPAATLQDTAGRPVRILLLANDITAGGVYVSARLCYSTSETAITQTDEVYIASAGRQVVDLGAIPLPPGNVGASYSDLSLRLYMRTATGTSTFDLDFIQLTPVDSFRRYSMVVSTTLAVNDSFVDDGMAELLYIDGAITVPMLVAAGAPLRLWPGRINRILLLSNQISSTYGEVRIYYRARKASL